MLKGIDPIVSPDLLHALASMGHGDEIAIVDANFPAAGIAQRLIRLPGVDSGRMLMAVLALLPIDSAGASPACAMQVQGDPGAIPPPIKEFQAILDLATGAAVRLALLERQAFYERARRAFVVAATSERRLYANIILAKGVIGTDHPGR